MPRKSFLVEVRHRRSNEAIALELGDELLVRNGGLVPALCYDRQIVQILQHFLVVGDRKHYAVRSPWSSVMYLTGSLTSSE